jgi:hypothetical protein
MRIRRAALPFRSYPQRAVLQVSRHERSLLAEGVTDGSFCSLTSQQGEHEADMSSKGQSAERRGRSE